MELKSSWPELKELKGDRREQTGMREKERLSLEWSRIVAAIAKVWKAPWEVVSHQRGNGAVGLAYYLGQRHAGMTLRELGVRFCTSCRPSRYPPVTGTVFEIFSFIKLPV